MDEYIWIGAKTGKVSRMLDNGMAEFDIREGSYDLYKKWKPDNIPKVVSVISFVDCDTSETIVEVYECYKDAFRRFDELHNDKFNVNNIFLKQAFIRKKGEEYYESSN